jgi:hypothetical protein
MSRVSDALERLRTAGSRVSRADSDAALEGPKFGPGCCAGELDELDAWWADGLPDDYREFLQLCRSVAAPDVGSGYFLYSPLLLLCRDYTIPKLVHVTLPTTLQEVFVAAIGGDGGGNQFLLGMSAAGRGRVWKWSHDYPVRFDGMAKDGLTSLAESFSRFLERVGDDWEHFLAGDRSWSYMSG